MEVMLAAAKRPGAGVVTEVRLPCESQLFVVVLPRGSCTACGCLKLLCVQLVVATKYFQPYDFRNRLCEVWQPGVRHLRQYRRQSASRATVAAVPLLSGAYSACRPRGTVCPSGFFFQLQSNPLLTQGRLKVAQMSEAKG